MCIRDRIAFLILLPLSRSFLKGDKKIFKVARVKDYFKEIVSYSKMREKVYRFTVILGVGIVGFSGYLYTSNILYHFCNLYEFFNNVNWVYPWWVYIFTISHILLINLVGFPIIIRRYGKNKPLLLIFSWFCALLAFSLTSITLNFYAQIVANRYLDFCVYPLILSATPILILFFTDKHHTKNGKKVILTVPITLVLTLSFMSNVYYFEAWGSHPNNQPLNKAKVEAIKYLNTLPTDSVVLTLFYKKHELYDYNLLCALVTEKIIELYPHTIYSSFSSSSHKLPIDFTPSLREALSYLFDYYDVQHIYIFLSQKTLNVVMNDNQLREICSPIFRNDEITICLINKTSFSQYISSGHIRSVDSTIEIEILEKHYSRSVIQVNATKPFYLLYFPYTWKVKGWKIYDGNIKFPWVMSESFHHELINNYVHVWYIDKVGSYEVTLYYWPANMFWLEVILLGIIVVILIRLFAYKRSIQS